MLALSKGTAAAAAAGRRAIWTTAARAAEGKKKMSQVDVDEPAVQQQLGQIQMDFVRRAERINADRVVRHKKTRRGDWTVAGGCVAVALSIYVYTIYAIKQESFRKPHAVAVSPNIVLRIACLLSRRL